MELEEVANILYDKLESAKGPVDIDHKRQQWVVAFGLIMEDLEEEEALPRDAPTEVPALYEMVNRGISSTIESGVPLFDAGC